ncbi:MAG: hypothetical protein ACPL1G_08030 [Thermodesulfovibrionales bacterium]
MIKKSPELIQFEKDFLRKERKDIIRNFKIFESMYREAVALGIIPLKNELEGLDVDIKIAKVINSVSKTTE